LIALTILLATVLDLAFEPYANRVLRLYYWLPSRAGLYWYGCPWTNFIGWAVVIVLILAFATPALMNKRPSKRPPDYVPLAIWAMLIAFLFCVSLTHHFLAAAVVSAIAIAAGVAMAIRGATW
jgi:uncharacterized membrane protein